MDTQLADVAPVDSRAAAVPAYAGYETDPLPDDEGMTVARGIVSAVLIATPFWALLAFTAYMLI